MTALSAARRVALELASERRRRDARARDLLRAAPPMARLGERDRALAMRLVLGSVAAEGFLDEKIDACLRANARLEPRVRDALRLSAFELLFLSTPKPVAVSQGTELARSVQPRAAGLANAVLRRISCMEATPGEAVPAWLRAGAAASMGEERARAWAERVLEPASPTVAYNHARLGADEARALLESAGCEPRASELPVAFALGRPSRLNGSGLVEAVQVVPCDLASIEVAQVAAPRPGERVLEVGQGRGTKSLLLMNEALDAGGACDVVAVELSARKSRAAQLRLERAGVADRARCLAMDGRELDYHEELGLFDLVFVDAPCSGSGTLRRRPEVAWSLDPASPARLASTQAALLHAASARVASGGRLVYATCSVLSQEDEQVVEGFLDSAAGAGFALARHGLTTHGSDTHFCAVLERRD